MKQYRLQIHVYNLYYTVKVYDRSLYNCFNSFKFKLSTFKVEYDKKTRRYKNKLEAQYYLYDTHKEVYRLPIKSFKLLLMYLKNEGVNKEEIDYQDHRKEITYGEFNYGFHAPFEFREDQKKYINAIKENLHKTILLIDAQTGGGKAQPLYSKVRIPNGWTTIGELKVGDEVITADGNITTVESIHPQPKQIIYKLTFYDGRSCECTGEHLFNVYLGQSHKTGKFQSVDDPDYFTTLSVNDLIKRGVGEVYNSEKRVYIPLVKPEKNEDKPFIIHPYILGCLLGDGTLSRGSIKLTISSRFVLDKIVSLLPPSLTIGLIRNRDDKCYEFNIIRNKEFNNDRYNIYTEEIKRLNLYGKIALTKFIPTEYLNGSEEQRWELLRGLMDTDGTIGKPKLKKNISNSNRHTTSGSISYSTSSYRLKDDIVELVRSLGGIAKVSIKIPYYTYKGEKLRGQTNYIITMRFKDPIMCVTRPNRLERLNNQHQYSRYFKLLLRTIVPLREDKAVCIKLKDPKGLYVTDDYIVTHNTAMSSYIVSYLKIKPAFILLPKYIEKWIDDCKLYFKANREDICVIQGADTLLKLLSTPSKDLKYQIYIFSLPTLDSYFKSYEAGEALFPLTPDEVMKHINAGVLVNDETHNSFRQLTSAMLYLDAKYMLCSSASFDSNNRSLKNLYKTVIPPENRISNLAKIERYVNVKAIRYDLRVTKGIRFKRSQGYNHILYEESIMKFTFLKLKYFAMVEYYLNDIYFKKRQSLNDKVAIFFASIAMCNEFTGYLASRYPNENIYKYVGGTSYGDMLNSNIIISNHQMLGTGIDVKGLIGVIQTVSTASLQANIQNFGRLRKIPDREIWYYYLFNFQLGRQKQMANERYEAIKDKIKSYYGEEYSIKLNG